MPLIAKGGGEFKPAPEGLWPAVCVDVIDLGVLKQEWNGKSRTSHKCRLVWEISEIMEETGLRYLVSKRYTVSLHEKSTLAKDLKSWRGVPFTKEELQGFDLELLISKPCNLVVQHDEKDGQIWANVTAIMRARKETKIVPSGSYVRMKDRPKENGEAGKPGQGGSYFDDDPPSDDLRPIGDDDIPF